MNALKNAHASNKYKGHILLLLLLWDIVRKENDYCCLTSRIPYRIADVAYPTVDFVKRAIYNEI